MKNKNRLLSSSFITIALASLANSAYAVDGTKADNGNALNDNASWVGSTPPTSGTGKMIIDSTLTAAQASNLGDNLSVLGITASSGQKFTVNATTGKTLTIGASGINSSGAGALEFKNATSLGGDITLGASAGAITFGGPLTLTAGQTWSLGSKRINMNNPLTTGGNTLNVTGSAGSILQLQGTIALGSEVTIGVARVYIQGGTYTITGTGNTNGSWEQFGGTANIASMGNLTGASSIGKGSASLRHTSILNYTGNTFSSDKGMARDNNNSGATNATTFNVVNAGQTLSMSGNFTNTANAASGWAFGGAGNLTLSGVISNSTGTGTPFTTVTKQDAGTLTLSDASNTFSGQTRINGGKLTIASTGNINSTSDILIAGGEFNYNASTALSQAVAFSGTGGTLSGNGTISQAVNVTTGNTLAIGNSTVGAMNFGGNLAVNGIYLHELMGGSSTADLGDVTGGLALGGILDLVQLGTYTAGNKFTLFAYDGTLSGTFTTTGLATIADDTQFTDAGGIWELNYNDTSAGLNGGTGTRYVTITAVPEPNVAALLGGLGVLCLLRRRRTA